MPVSWPIDLPTSPLYGDTEAGQDRLIFQQTAVGPGKLRSRYTAGPAPLSVSYVLGLAGANRLMEFYNETTGGGALSFDFLHPRDGSAVVVRFRPGAPPLLTRISYEKWRASVQLDVVA